MARDPNWHLLTTTTGSDGLLRCAWCSDDPLYQDYHDREWGRPLKDASALFEMLCLEGAQAGLSWITILRKRQSYREAFDGFDAEKMAGYGPAKVQSLLADPGIVRNRLKVAAFIKNAQAYLRIAGRPGGFEGYIWGFVDGRPLRNSWEALGQIPAGTPQSDAMSRQLKRDGFTFVGSTICYAFMQAVGMVDDHLPGCWVREEQG